MRRPNPAALLCIALLLAPSLGRAGDALGDCNETHRNTLNTLRACDVVIGRRGTNKAVRIQAFQIRGKTHLATGNVSAAIADFTSAIDALPNGKLKGYVLFLRAQSRFDYTEKTATSLKATLDDLEIANDLAPDNPRILESLAKAYSAAGQHEDAARTAALVLTIDPRALNAYKVRATAFEALGQTHDAILELNTLLDRKLRDPELLAWRGRLHEKRRNAYLALADYRNAARLETTNELLAGIKRMKALLGVE